MTYAVNVANSLSIIKLYNDKSINLLNPLDVELQLKAKSLEYLKGIIEKVAESEAEEQIGASHYARGKTERKDYRNGYRCRSLGTHFGTIDICVPRARRTNLKFNVFERYKRRWKSLDALIVEAHIGGVSCRVAGERIAALIGCSVSGSTVSKLQKALVEKLRSFKHAPLKDEYKALIIDGMYVRIKQCGKQKRPVVAVIGVKENGEEALLGIKVCYSENSTEVEGLLRSIKERGVRGVNLDIITIDGDRGLEGAVNAVYGNARIQDCVFHKINRLHQNAVCKKRGRKMMKDAAKAFEEKDIRKQPKALMEFSDKWRKIEPKAIELFERNISRCFEVNILPEKIRSKASTTGACEGMFKQIRARIRQIGAFQSPMAVEAYVYAIMVQKKWLNIPGRSIGQPLLYEFTHFS